MEKGTSKKLKTKTFLAAEAQRTQRKPWFFPLRTLRLCGKAFSCELLASRLVGFWKILKSFAQYPCAFASQIGLQAA
jgi:hypothetical protein